MSYTSEKTRTNPKGLAATMAINGGVILAIILTPSYIIRDKNTPHTSVFNIPISKPQEPDKQQKSSKNTMINNPIFAPKPKADLPDPPANQTSTTHDDTGPVNSFSNGDGGNIAVDPPKPKAQPLPVPIFKPAARDPHFARDFQPPYPYDMEQREIEGLVTAKVLIGTDGRVRQVIIVSASHPSFGKAVEKQAIKSWHFIPATRGGNASEDWLTLTVRFTLNNGG